MACKGCGGPARVQFPVGDSCLLFDEATGSQIPLHNDSWKCFMDGCDDECCTRCYMTHIEAKHPEQYSASCTCCGSLTLYKNFVEYGVCKECFAKKATNNELGNEANL